MAFFFLVARLNRLSYFRPMSRFLLMSYLSHMARFRHLVLLRILTRLSVLVYSATLAFHPLDSGSMMCVWPSMASAYNGVVLSPFNVRPTNQ